MNNMRLKPGTRHAAPRKPRMESEAARKSGTDGMLDDAGRELVRIHREYLAPRVHPGRDGIVLSVGMYGADDDGRMDWVPGELGSVLCVVPRDDVGVEALLNDLLALARRHDPQAQWDHNHLPRSNMARKYLRDDELSGEVAAKGEAELVAASA